jgi:AraC family transcriptional regulator
VRVDEGGNVSGVDARQGIVVTESESVSWSPRWYMWDGGFFAVGRSKGVVPPHSHHAIQVWLSVAGMGRIAGPDGVWQECQGLIVRPDVEHSFNGCSAPGAMLFVDPESREGAWLASSLVRDVTVVPESRLATFTTELRLFCEEPLAAMEVCELIRHCVRGLCAGAPPTRQVDERIARVMAAIRESEDMRLSLEDAAGLVYLSPSRFTHLFTEQVGLPFRRYMLWRKLGRAMLAIGRGRTLSAAAHTGGFADAAHLTRTFYQMFGIPPSTMMRGDFFEVPAPFQLPS